MCSVLVRAFIIVCVSFAEAKCYHSDPNDSVMCKTKLFRQTIYSYLTYLKECYVGFVVKAGSAVIFGILYPLQSKGSRLRCRIQQECP